MNILKIADGVTGLFPKKIMVTLIDELSGTVIGDYKASKESLPAVFNRPMVVEMNGKKWRVTKAEHSRSKRLSLYMQEETLHIMHNRRCMVPTLAAKPKTIAQDQAPECKLEIRPEDWRQLEFLSTTMQEPVEEELKLIEAVAEEGGLHGYDRVHTRENIKEPPLNIPFREFYQLVDGKEKGGLQLAGEGLIEDGFFIRTDEYVYYGLEKEQLIKMLCLKQFDCADEEFTKVIDEYDLILANWCNGSII